MKKYEKRILGNTYKKTYYFFYNKICYKLIVTCKRQSTIMGLQFSTFLQLEKKRLHFTCHLPKHNANYNGKKSGGKLTLKCSFLYIL